MKKEWVNGEVCQQIAVTDRGLAYGDGFFTTMKVVDSNIQLWHLHLKRIQNSLLRLSFPALDLKLLHKELMLAAQQLKSGIIKLIISRGSGGRGYSLNNCNDVVRIMQCFPPVNSYDELKTNGINLINCSTPISGIPQLAGLKTLNRLEQVLIKQELESAGAFEGIVCDLKGDIVECCAANVFWRKNNAVFTPKLQHCGVDGVMRQHVMALFAKVDNLRLYTISEVIEPLDTLASADELFITNSLMSVLPVAQYNDKQFTDFSLSHQLNALI